MKPCTGKHTPQPDGYLAWHEWAEKKAKTHKQERCPHCGLWAIWVHKEEHVKACAREASEQGDAT